MISTMRSFIDLDRTFGGQPRALGAELSRIDTGRGQERLFADQLPELLRALSQSARIASITASNAIENVTVAKDRAQRIAEGSSRFRNRNEKEFAGYRDAMDYIMRLESYEQLTMPFLLHLHRLLFEHVDGRGGHLKSDQNLIVSYESGRRDVVFTPPDERMTPMLFSELLDRYAEARREGRTHPVVLIGALIVDLLAIHPVADGNGRLARLITTHELLAAGYGIPRYISVEQRVFEAKNAYYQSLYESQRGWHEGRHTIWPWTTFLVRILGGAYNDFERRVAAGSTTTGSKQDRVREHILHQAPAEFRTRDVHRALPGISAATVRLVLKELRDAGRISSHGTGAGARWRVAGR
jgi:Fic family protein